MAEENGKNGVNLPRWVWGTVGTLGAAILILLVSFFTWLGLAVVRSIENDAEIRANIVGMRNQITAMQKDISGISEKTSSLPPAQIAVNQAKIAGIEIRLRDLERNP